MPATYSKLKLSGSTNGKAIKLAATATPGTLVHTSVSGLVDYDEAWLYATNNHTGDVDLTIEWGGVASPDDIVEITIPAKTGLYLVIPGLVLQNGLIVRAFASVTNVISVFGWVNRIEQ